MATRGVLFGTYDTAAQGWTLTGLALSEPQMKTNYVTVPGADGDLDLSTALTEGEPRYQSRTLTVTLERSDGTRMERKAAIDTMTNWLDGWRMNMVLPDDPDRYLVGRPAIKMEYNDNAHAAVTVTAVVEPWRYSAEEKVVTLTATAEEQTATLTNAGRRAVVPLLTITGEGASVLLAFGTASWALGAGTYALPDLRLVQGDATLTYSGTGTATLTYREAVL